MIDLYYYIGWIGNLISLAMLTKFGIICAKRGIFSTVENLFKTKYRIEKNKKGFYIIKYRNFFGDNWNLHRTSYAGAKVIWQYDSRKEAIEYLKWYKNENKKTSC